MKKSILFVCHSSGLSQQSLRVHQQIHSGALKNRPPPPPPAQKKRNCDVSFGFASTNSERAPSIAIRMMTSCTNWRICQAEFLWKPLRLAQGTPKEHLHMLLHIWATLKNTLVLEAPDSPLNGQGTRIQSAGHDKYGGRPSIGANNGR